MAKRIDYCIEKIHIKKVSTVALVSGDACTQIVIQAERLPVEVLNFLNSFVGTDKNASHELDMAFIAFEEE